MQSRQRHADRGRIRNLQGVQCGAMRQQESGIHRIFTTNHINTETKEALMWKEIGKAWRTAWRGVKEHWCAMWRAFGGFWVETGRIIKQCVVQRVVDWILGRLGL